MACFRHNPLVGGLGILMCRLLPPGHPHLGGRWSNGEKRAERPGDLYLGHRCSEPASQASPCDPQPLLFLECQPPDMRLSPSPTLLLARWQREKCPWAKREVLCHPLLPSPDPHSILSDLVSYSSQLLRRGAELQKLTALTYSTRFLPSFFTLRLAHAAKPKLRLSEASPRSQMKT